MFDTINYQNLKINMPFIFCKNTINTIPLLTNCTIQEIKLCVSNNSLKSTSGTFTFAIIPTHSIMHSISFIIVTK